MHLSVKAWPAYCHKSRIYNGNILYYNLLTIKFMTVKRFFYYWH